MEALNPDAFVTFVQSVMESLPSSSQSTNPSIVKIFGDYLVDMIWSMDSELDEILADARLTITSCGDAATSNLATVLAKTKKVKQNAESDKETLTVIVKKLLVCLLHSVSMFV